MQSKAKSPIFLGLQAYSSIGGIQRFNRRLVLALSEIQSRCGLRRPIAGFLRDSSADEPGAIEAELLLFGGNRVRFLWQSVIRAFRDAEILIIGHINLLPLATIVRLLRPSLPIVMIAHGIEVWDEPPFRRKRFFEPTLIRFAVDHIAAVSVYTAKTMADRFSIPSKKFVIFPNAVDPISAASAETIKSQTIVLTVTRLTKGEEKKHIDKLIRAIAHTRQQCPDIVCEIAGDGDLRPELESLAIELGISDQIRFLGRISDADLEAAYQRATVFALPSSKEGFGIVFLEAWLRHLPVICSVHGAPIEVIENNVDGIAVDPCDTLALAKAICLLATDRGLASNFGEAGFAKVMQTYLHEHFRKRLYELIYKTVERSNRPQE